MAKSLSWYLRRHSLLYKIRFRLVSKKVSAAYTEKFCYNTINKKKDIPALFYELNQSIFDTKKEEQTDLKKAKTIAKWLKNNITGGAGLGKSSQKALLKMIKGQGGVCSDFAQVYNNFCVINDLKVKEWGLKITSTNQSINGGHSFNEIYSKELDKWVIIDVSKSILFYQNDSKKPLSVIELMHLKKENKKIIFDNFNKNKPLDEKRIKDLYFNSNSFPFLITHYCNKTYDTFLDFFGFLPESIIHGLIYFTGNSYIFEFPQLSQTATAPAAIKTVDKKREVAQKNIRTKADTF